MILCSTSWDWFSVTWEHKRHFPGQGQKNQSLEAYIHLISFSQEAASVGTFLLTPLSWNNWWVGYKRYMTDIQQQCKWVVGGWVWWATAPAGRSTEMSERILKSEERSPINILPTGRYILDADAAFIFMKCLKLERIYLSIYKEPSREVP